MLDIGWSELILIGIVALIVVGPKDLPRMFHTLGRFTGKLRAMGREFQSAMNDAAKSTGLDEMRRDMNDIVSKKSLGLDALDRAAAKFESWDPTKPSQTPTPMDKAAAAAAERARTAATAAEIEADADLEDSLLLATETRAKPAPVAATPPAAPAASDKADVPPAAQKAGE